MFSISYEIFIWEICCIKSNITAENYHVQSCGSVGLSEVLDNGWNREKERVTRLLKTKKHSLSNDYVLLKPFKY